jgi:alanyl-tRNA synthetase
LERFSRDREEAGALRSIRIVIVEATASIHTITIVQAATITDQIVEIQAVAGTRAAAEIEGMQQFMYSWRQ